ncbi:hypothetical protein D3C71_1924690 [compost metagenome]
MPRILPKIIDCTLTEVGLSDTINRPTAKKVEKIKPIMASSRRRVTWRTSVIASAASMPVKKAPAA